MTIIYDEIGYEKYDKFFCICENCGSLAWTDSNGESNQLNEDGEMLIEKDTLDILKSIRGNGNDCFCHNCEKPLKPIMFNRISKKERIKIYNMSEETRANWMKSYEIVDELEKQEKQDNK